jgi:hypothetical protein
MFGKEFNLSKRALFNLRRGWRVNRKVLFMRQAQFGCVSSLFSTVSEVSTSG